MKVYQSTSHHYLFVKVHFSDLAPVCFGVILQNYIPNIKNILFNFYFFKTYTPSKL